MKKITKEDYRDLMYQLYAHRIENPDIKRMRRFEMDKAIITSELVGRRLISSQDEEFIHDTALGFSYMASLEDIAKSVQQLAGDFNLSKLAKFSREDGINDLFLAKRQIEKLIKEIQKQNPEYQIFYK